MRKLARSRIAQMTFIVSMTSLSSGCATSNQKHTFILMGSAVGAGAVIGTSRSDEKNKNALLYGSFFGLTAAIASQLIFNDSAAVRDLSREAEELRRENSKLNLKTSPALSDRGESLLAAPVPKDLKRLVSPGSWRRYKLDRWVQEEGNENVWFRQTEMFEVTPPAISGE